MRRKSGGLKRKHIEDSWKSMHESRNVRIEDVHSSGIAGMRA
jgi:hypothetical protein